jgi:hypothetical protein
MTQKATKSGGALRTIWSVEHRNGAGVLISRPCSVKPPDPPQCVSPVCLGKWLKDSLFVALLASYHHRRVAYAEQYYSVADEVDGQWKVRRAGLVPETQQRYPYTKSFETLEAALRETAKVHSKVLERYRTGKPAPQNLWQVFHALTKLRCWVCRKYNVDPLLFDGKK